MGHVLRCIPTPDVEISIGQKWQRHSGTLEILGETKKGYRCLVTWNSGEANTYDVAPWEVRLWVQNSLNGK